MVQHKLLTFRPNTKEYALKQNNLERKEKFEQAVEIMDQWIKKQSHFLKKDFDRRYLENSIFTAKGSIEKAKDRFEKMCIFKTMLPKFVDITDIREDCKNMLATQLGGVPMPKLTEGHNRVLVYKLVNDVNFVKMSMMEIYKFIIILFEYLKLHDLHAGYIIVADLREINIFDMIAKINILELKHLTTLLFEVLGFPMKNLIYLTHSKAIDHFVKIIKSVLSDKLKERMEVVNDEESLHKIVEKEVLPKELGGLERSGKDIQDEWVNLLSNKKNMECFAELRKAGVTEDYKKIIKENDKYTEMAGSFVSLDFD